MRKLMMMLLLTALVGCQSPTASRDGRPYRDPPQSAADFIAKGRHLGSQKGMEARAMEYINLGIAAAGTAQEEADGYNGLGDIYFRLKRDKEAAQCYAKALRVNPGNPYARTMLGASLLNAGKYETAIRQFGEVLAEYPKFGEAHAWRGLAYHRQRLWAKAIPDYQDALLRSLPKALRVKLLAGLGDAYVKTGEYQLALEAWQEMIRLEPDMDTPEVRRYMQVAREAQKQKAGM